MKKILPTLILLFAFIIGYGQSSKLLGKVTRDSLLKTPYREWYQANYDAYTPEPEILSKLQKLSLKDYSVEIFFGTWCGDSKREIPRLLKIADLAGWPSKNFSFIGVDTGEQYKQSPGGETEGRGIYRVATFIISKNGKEINRITEHPVRTLELDLLAILSGKEYSPNYRGFPLIDEWMAQGILSSPNVSVRGLAKQLKPLLASPAELNACGYVLMAQHKMQEAITVLSINAYIFYETANSYLSLAEALTKDNQHEAAMENLEYAFHLNDDDGLWKSMLDQYYQARSARDEKTND